MRHSAAEKMEIIRLVEGTDLPVQATLKQLGVPKSTFYGWYQKYLEHGFDGLEPGDRLLGFVGDATVPRYCHHFDEAELEQLTDGLGLSLVDDFTAHGKSDDPNAYRVLVKRGG